MSNTLLLCAVLVPFVLCTAYWIVNIIQQIVMVKVYFVYPAERHGRNITHLYALFYAVMKANVSFQVRIETHVVR